HAAPAPAVYTLSLHDALPISLARVDLPDTQCRVKTRGREAPVVGAERHRLYQIPMALEGTQFGAGAGVPDLDRLVKTAGGQALRSEEHTSELQSRGHLVCRLL